MFSYLLTLVSLSFTSLVAAQIVKTGTLTSYGPQLTNITCGGSCVNNYGWIAVSQANIDDYPCGTIVRVWDPANTVSVVVPICDTCTTCANDDFEANPDVVARIGYVGASTVPGAHWDI
ncbi:hypothetical protein BOTBODRAFT_31530 [Botryobasidium botryosum FD-172 SS1]|uniref:RlpA-like protein double-psi beta-barrel domain-containing protein n=1 Tax=Botryobasidium botryosum (strain FD-172 SS1) TaxID=930990 RepID=A0A067MIN1_BOTB1|nr:hypothetical protein BOTBODRAFT_31530 [Botryobasidium botryosum FD-172 SS1]